MSDGNTYNLEGMEQAGDGQTLSLRRIRRILNESRDSGERRRAAQELMPRLWDRFPWQRYYAGCVLTTRVYLPATLLLLEWGSFPNVLSRELRRIRHGMPTTAEAQRAVLTQTLGSMLARWYNKLDTGRRGEASINMDIAADVCEAIGRLGITEAEKDLLDVISRFFQSGNQVRFAAVLALAALPPDGLTLTWNWLRDGTVRERRLVAAALAYMVLPEATPFLLEALPRIAGDSALQESVGIPLLMALGRIGDPRALPDLNDIARADRHPLQPTARKAIRRIMKVAEGHEEVTLVRASGASFVAEDMLLRPSSENAASSRPEQLLRASAPQNTARTGNSGTPVTPFAIEPHSKESDTASKIESKD